MDSVEFNRFKIMESLWKKERSKIIFLPKRTADENDFLRGKGRWSAVDRHTGPAVAMTVGGKWDLLLTNRI